MNIKKLLTIENRTLLIRYILISLQSYCYIFISLYVLVDVFQVNKTSAFLIVYGLLYIFLYVIQLKYLFKKKHSVKRMSRFYISLFSFYLFANILYNIGLWLEINYLISTIISITILMPLRLITAKFFVFK